MNISTIGVNEKGFISIHTPEYNYINDGVSINSVSIKKSISFNIAKKVMNKDTNKIEIVTKKVDLNEGDKISFKVSTGRILNDRHYKICKGVVREIIIKDENGKDTCLSSKAGRNAIIVLDDSTNMNSVIHEVKLYMVVDAELYDFDWEEDEKISYPKYEYLNTEYTEDQFTSEINIPISNTFKY